MRKTTELPAILVPLDVSACSIRGDRVRLLVKCLAHDGIVGRGRRAISTDLAGNRHETNWLIASPGGLNRAGLP